LKRAEEKTGRNCDKISIKFKILGQRKEGITERNKETKK
jgi:hypothetical protein